MDQASLDAALEQMTARRRSSRRTLVVVNGLLLLGLAAFFIGPEIRCEDEVVDMPEVVPAWQRPFVATSELAVLPPDKLAKITGINFSNHDFYIAPRPDGAGWYYASLASVYVARPAYVERLMALLARVPVMASPDGHGYAPDEVRIRIDGQDDVVLNIGEVPPAPAATLVSVLTADRQVLLIRAEDARVLFPTAEEVIGAEPVPITKQ